MVVPSKDSLLLNVNHPSPVQRGARGANSFPGQFAGDWHNGQILERSWQVWVCLTTCCWSPSSSVSRRKHKNSSLCRRPSNRWISIPFNMFVFDLMFYTPVECIGTIFKLLPLASRVSRAFFKLSVLGIWGQSWRTTSFEFHTCWPTTEGYDKREVLTLQSHVCAGPLQSTDVLFF